MTANPSTTPTRPRGRSSSLLRGNVAALALISLLNDAASEMIYPLLPLFLVQTLGAGPAFIGVVEGVAETTASLIKLWGGWLSDRIRRRTPLVVAGYSVAALARPLIAVAAAPWHVLAIRFLDRVGKGVRTAPRDALLAGSVPPGRRGMAFGVHRAADHFGAVIGPVLAAGILLVSPNNLRLVFALAAIPGLIAVVVAVAAVREVQTARTEPPRHRAPSFRGLGTSFSRFLVAMVVFTLGNASDAFLLLLARERGVPTVALPLVWAAFHVVKSLSSLAGGWLTDRMRPRTIIVTGWVLYAAVYAGLAAAHTPWQIVALFLVYGIFFGLTEAPEKTLVAAMAPPAFRGRAFGAYHFAVGLAALPASLIFGAIWQTVAPAAAFTLGAALALTAAGLLWFWTPDGASRS